MTDHNEQFTPEAVNEQIRHFSSASHAGANQRLIHDLRRAMSDNEAGDDARSLQRSWERIASTQQESTHHIHTTFKERKKVIALNAYTNKAGKASLRKGQRFGALIAAAVALILIGSMAYVFTIMRNNGPRAVHGNNTLTGSNNGSSSQDKSLVPAKQGDTITIYKQNGYGVYSVHWSPDGKRIVSTGQGIASWDAMTGQNSVEYSMLPDPDRLIAQGKKKSGIDFLYPAAQWSPDSKSFALPFHSDIQIWDGSSKQLLKTLKYQFPQPDLPEQRIFYVHWSPDGKSISAIAPITDSPGGPTNRLVTFDVASGAKKSEVTLAAFGQLNRVAWSPDGNYLAAAYFDKQLVYVVSLKTGQIVHSYNGIGTVVDRAWSPDSKDISQAWDAVTGNNVITHKGGTLPAWSPDGKYIITAGANPDKGYPKNAPIPPDKLNSTSDEVQVWEAATGKTVYVDKQYTGSVEAIDWSPDSKYVVYGGIQGNNNKSIEIRVWCSIM